MEFWTIVYLLLCASAAEPSSSVCHHFVPQCQQLSHAVMLTIIIIKRTNTHTRSEWMDLIWLLTKWQCEHLVLKIKAGFLKNKSEQREPSVHYINTETLWTVQLLSCGFLCAPPCYSLPTGLSQIQWLQCKVKHCAFGIVWVWTLNALQWT